MINFEILSSFRVLGSHIVISCSDIVGEQYFVIMCAAVVVGHSPFSI